MITFDDLVTIGRDTQIDDTDTPCLTCQAGPGRPCGEFCDDRGAEASRRIRGHLTALTAARFEPLLNEARARAAHDDDTPGFHWTWEAVDEEATARNYPAP